MSAFYRSYGPHAGLRLHRSGRITGKTACAKKLSQLKQIDRPDFSKETLCLLCFRSGVVDVRRLA